MQCEFLQLSCSSLSALFLVEAHTWSSHLLVSYEDGDDMDAVRGRAIDDTDVGCSSDRTYAGLV